MKAKTINAKHTTGSSIGIQKRNCAWPQLGKAYLSIPVGAYGSPIWNFLIDPTMTIEGLDVKKLGMTLLSRGCYDANGKEIYDIWDWIGSGAYPNPTDWLMEVAHFGLHQLIERTAQFGLLSRDSYYVAVHDRAGIVNPYELYHNRLEGNDFPICPYDYPQHVEKMVGWLELQETCPGILFNDLIKGELTGNKSREVIRKNASFSYTGYMPPDTLDTEHVPAAFFKAPFGAVGQFLVYEDKVGNDHLETLKALEALDESMQNVQIVSIDEDLEDKNG